MISSNASIAEPKMRSRDASLLTVITAIAAAAIVGGAFHPGPRIVVGLAFALGCGVAMFSWIGRFAIEENVLFAFLSWGVVTSIVASTAQLAGREVLTTWLVASMVWIITRRATLWAGRVALRVMIGAALVVAAGVALESAASGRLRVGGLLENPNLTASLLVVSIPAVLAEGGFRNRRVRFAIGVALVAGVVLTGSRAGLLAVLAAAAVVLPRGRVRALGIGAGAVGATAILVWRFVSQPEILAWFRPSIWVAVLRVWAEHPVVGVGPGGLVDAMGAMRLLHADHIGQRQYLAAYAESTPLAVLVTTGVVGFLMVLTVVVLWLRGARTNGALADARLRAVVVAMAAMAAFHDLITADVVLWWWAAVIGLLEAPYLRGRLDGSRSAGTTGIRVTAAMIAAYVVLWGMVEPSWARWLWRSGDRDVVVVDRAIRADPWYWVPLDWRASTLFEREAWSWQEAGEALARSRRAVEARPGSGALWGGVALSQARVVTDFGPWPDAVREAEMAFSRAAELEPHQPWPWLEWARFSRTMGRIDEAVGLARRAIAEEPHAVRAWLFIARLELDRGQVDLARQALASAHTSFAKRARHDLNAYERDLLWAPAWQFRELEEALQ